MARRGSPEEKRSRPYAYYAAVGAMIAALGAFITFA
jgi:hypothetical protein